MKKYINTLLYASIILIFYGCGLFGNSEGGNINFFTISQDKEFGLKVNQEILSDKLKYPLLDSISNQEVYQYLYKIRASILNSGQVKHKDDFNWEMKIIHDDSVINAFCTPGGYIYVYTGLIKFLDSEDQLAGVIGHEIAHADLRHSTQQMSKTHGVKALSDIILGDNLKLLKQIGNSLVNLSFSRAHESQADANSVKYLCATEYNADGGAGFFEKINAQGGGKTIEFLSTHPNPSKRIQHFKDKKQELGCTGNTKNQREYNRIKNLIPPSK